MNQGYLNLWPERYGQVHIVQHPGSNLAPWNVDGHVLARDSGRIAVDGQPLIFYHFSGVSRNSEGQWCSHHPRFDRDFDLVCESIYHPYILAVEAESRWLKGACGIEGTGTVRSMSGWPSVVQFSPSGGPAIPQP
jgi:hypothetical protein